MSARSNGYCRTNSGSLTGQIDFLDGYAKMEEFFDWKLGVKTDSGASMSLWNKCASLARSHWALGSSYDVRPTVDTPVRPTKLAQETGPRRRDQ